MSNNAGSSLPLFANRNIRYTILLVFVLLCTGFLLVRHQGPPSGPHPFGDGMSIDAETKFRPHGVSLEEWVRREEMYYLESLEGRRELITRYGGEPSRVASFPQGPTYTLWDFFIPSFNCPHRIDRIGQRGDGGKWICGVERLAQKRTPCVIYSFGVEQDSTFEAALLNRAPNCEIWGYDFSVSEFGPQIRNNPFLSPKLHFHPYALGATDNHNANPKAYTLKSIIEENGHDFIDILKIDVEGSEFDALNEFTKPYLDPNGPAMPVGQMEIEIHAWGNNGDFSKFLKWWEDLERAGLRPFFTEPNLPYANRVRGAPDLSEYSFINVKVRHALVAEGF